MSEHLNHQQLSRQPWSDHIRVHFQFWSGQVERWLSLALRFRSKLARQRLCNMSQKSFTAGSKATVAVCCGL